jgi:hypothetical protein
MSSVLSEGVPAILDFDCPRCHAPASETYYGPCGSCIDQLRATQGLAQSDAKADEYVPKMNVTPNAVATKD